MPDRIATERFPSALRGELTSEPIQQAGHRPDKEARTEAAAVVGLPEVEQDRQEDDRDRQEDRPRGNGYNQLRDRGQPEAQPSSPRRGPALMAELDATCLARPVRHGESPG